MFILVLIKDGVESEVQVLNKEKFTVGRNKGMDWVFEDRTVSPYHASFTLEEGRVFVEDQKSVNGVVVNNKRILSKTALKLNDKIIIGLQLLELQLAPNVFVLGYELGGKDAHKRLEEMRRILAARESVIAVLKAFVEDDELKYIMGDSPDGSLHPGDFISAELKHKFHLVANIPDGEDYLDYVHALESLAKTAQDHARAHDFVDELKEALRKIPPYNK